MPRSAAFANVVGALTVLGSSAFAAKVATIGDKAVILPWGDCLVALAVSQREPILIILIAIVTGYAIQAIRKLHWQEV